MGPYRSHFIGGGRDSRNLVLLILSNQDYTFRIVFVNTPKFTIPLFYSGSVY